MHTLIRTMKTAGRALKRNVMRSALTCLGIIIGVAAVIAMMEIGQGSSAMIQKSIASMGANTLLVLPGTAASGGISWGSGSVMSLTPLDCDAITRECPAVRNSAPIVRTRSQQIIYGNRNWVPATILGSTANYLDIHDWSSMAEGESFTDRDVRNGNKVCILGQTLVRELFGGEAPVGKDIRMGSVTFRVVGVLTAKGANMFGSDQDDIVIAPWTTIKYRVSAQSTGGAAQASVNSASATSTAVNTLSSLYPNSTATIYPQLSTAQQADTPLPVRFANIDQINCDATSSKTVADAVNQVTALLHDRHHLPPGEPDDFMIRDMTELTRTMSSTTAVMGTLLLSVALISLIVGGVGIMNIMLVSVTERTREIGLRMAVGARSRDILSQFLIEATILCLAGGAVGICLGRGGSLLVRAILHWPTQISIPAIIISALVSGFVGLVFGFYPAWKASRLDPIEALRYE
jgi:ABC-type antimicrobial peptide transport system permease subunit